MSIIVKGIELPEKVQVLELHPDGKVFTRKGYLVGEAVELPDKHGRLIDENEVMVSQKECSEISSCQECRMHVSCCADMEEIIRNAPTIVEAEGEG